MPAESLKEMKMHHFVVDVGQAARAQGAAIKSNQRKTQTTQQCITVGHTHARTQPHAHTHECQTRGEIGGGGKRQNTTLRQESGPDQIENKASPRS